MIERKAPPIKPDPRLVIDITKAYPQRDKQSYMERLFAALQEISEEKIAHVASLLNSSRDQQVFVLGNGGSQANASHLVLHLINAGFNARDMMAETAWLTAHSNDLSYDTAPGKLLHSLANSHDVLIVISGSGKSANIISALQSAQECGMKIIGLLGFGGGYAVDYCDLAVVLPQEDYGPIEDTHSAVIHIIGEMVQ